MACRSGHRAMQNNYVNAKKNQPPTLFHNNAPDVKIMKKTTKKNSVEAIIEEKPQSLEPAKETTKSASDVAETASDSTTEVTPSLEPAEETTSSSSKKPRATRKTSTTKKTIASRKKKTEKTESLDNPESPVNPELTEAPEIPALPEKLETPEPKPEQKLAPKPETSEPKPAVKFVMPRAVINDIVELGQVNPRQLILTDAQIQQLTLEDAEQRLEYFEQMLARVFDYDVIISDTNIWLELLVGHTSSHSDPRWGARLQFERQLEFLSRFMRHRGGRFMMMAETYEEIDRFATAQDPVSHQEADFQDQQICCNVAARLAKRLILSQQRENRLRIEGIGAESHHAAFADPAIIRRTVDFFAQGMKVLLITNDASVGIRSLGLCDDLQRYNGIDDATWEQKYAPLRPMVLTFDDLRMMDQYTRQYHFLLMAAGKGWMEGVERKHERTSVEPLRLWMEAFRPGDRHRQPQPQMPVAQQGKQKQEPKQTKQNNQESQKPKQEQPKQEPKQAKQETQKSKQEQPKQPKQEKQKQAPVKKETAETPENTVAADVQTNAETPAVQDAPAASPAPEAKPAGKRRPSRRGGRKPKAQHPAPQENTK